MEKLSFTKGKSVIDCRQIFLEKNCFINKTFHYKLCTIQDLYDITSLKNGTNIDLAADLIFKYKNLKIVVPESQKLKNLSLQLCESFKSLGLNAKLFNLEDKPELKKTDVILVLKPDLNCSYYKNFLNECSMKNLKIINILPQKHKSQEEKFGINLYYLGGFNLRSTLCAEILLKSIYLGILAKCSKKNCQPD